jgi:hypothetical protein
MQCICLRKLKRFHVAILNILDAESRQLSSLLWIVFAAFSAWFRVHFRGLHQYSLRLDLLPLLLGWWPESSFYFSFYLSAFLSFSFCLLSVNSEDVKTVVCYFFVSFFAGKWSTAFTIYHLSGVRVWLRDHVWGSKFEIAEEPCPGPKLPELLDSDSDASGSVPLPVSFATEIDQ